MSRLTDVFLPTGATVYVVVDGYGDDAGDYTLTVDLATPCPLACPPGALPEGEPAFQSDVPDTYNCGCDCEGVPAFQEITGDRNGEALYCLHSGWRGWYAADSDWLLVTVGEGGIVNLDLETPFAVYVVVKSGPDCAHATILHLFLTDECDTLTYGIEELVGTRLMIQIRPYAAYPTAGVVPQEFEISVALSGLARTEPTESVSWGSVKGLYR